MSTGNPISSATAMASSTETTAFPFGPHDAEIGKELVEELAVFRHFDAAVVGAEDLHAGVISGPARLIAVCPPNCTTTPSGCV